MDGYSRFVAERTKLFRASEIREILKLTEGKDVISLAGGLPDPRVFPKAELAEISREIIEEYGDSALQYSPTAGVTPFRKTLREFMASKGIKVRDQDDVVVTTGSQEALFIISRILIDPGDLIVIEEPTYLAAANVFREHGAEFEAVPIDEEGMKTDILEEKLRKLKSDGRSPKLVYTVPTAQNPSGATMSLERRKHLIELAEQYDFLVIEDDPYSFFMFEEKEVEYLKTIDNNGRVLYLSTLSKILAPGLRIGWILGDESLTRFAEMSKQSIDLHSATLSQYIAMEAIKRGVVDSTIEKARSVYRSKRDAMMEALEETMSDIAWWTRPVGGFFTMVFVNGDIDMKVLLEIAVHEYKVAYVPGESFFPVSHKRNTMRLNYSYPSEDQIREGVKRISKLVKKYLKN